MHSVVVGRYTIEGLGPHCPLPIAPITPQEIVVLLLLPAATDSHPPGRALMGCGGTKLYMKPLVEVNQAN